jgi:hypothetical protein
MTVPTPWRTVRSLQVMGAQLDALWPTRNRASDGTIAGPDHAKSGGHWPHRVPALGATFVVTARDITHDAARGVDCGPLTESLRRSKDPRIKYVIFNRRVFSNPAYSHADTPWAWRNYDEEDPHTNHAHVEVLDAAIADNAAPWQLTIGGTVTQPTSAPYSPDTARALAIGATSAGWVTALPPNWDDELGTYNLKSVEERLTAQIQAQASEPALTLAQDIAAHLIESDALRKMIAEEVESAIARVRIVVDPAV